MSETLPARAGSHLQTLESDRLPAEMSAAEEWLENFTSKRTRSAYYRSIRDFTGFAGVVSLEGLAAVSRGEVIRWREEMKGRGLAPRTMAARLSALSSLFDHLCDRQLAERNPVDGVKRERVERNKVSAVALSREQVRKLLDSPNTETIGGLRDRALLHLFFFAGCRLSEPCGLRVRDYGWDQGFRVVDFTVKGGKRNRVAIHPDCVFALDAYLAAAGHGEDRDAWLFRQVKHMRPEPISRWTLAQIFQKYKRIAELPPGVTPHSARATFITEALERDHPAEAVQKTVAHADISTTLSYDKREHHPRKSASFAVRY